MWTAGSHDPQILIPLETEESACITGFVVLADKGFPEGGQSTLFDYAGASFRESCASLTIHHELGNPTLEDGYTITLLKLAQTIDNCNIYSSNHGARTGFWARQIGRWLDLSASELDQVELAGKIHDVGKVVVPKAVLTKPARLSGQEWLIMRRHPTFGAMILQPSLRLHALIPSVKAHHEWFDGTGYPAGLIGDQIPFQARILSVADAYTTITEGRVYRQPADPQSAIQELKRFSGRQFDPQIVDVMVALIESGLFDDVGSGWG